MSYVGPVSGNFSKVKVGGGMFHWKKDLAYSVTNEGVQLYHEVPKNTLLNDVFFYIMYHLLSFQNMHEYQVTVSDRRN